MGTTRSCLYSINLCPFALKNVPLLELVLELHNCGFNFVILRPNCIAGFLPLEISSSIHFQDKNPLLGTDEVSGDVIEGGFLHAD